MKASLNISATIRIIGKLVVIEGLLMLVPLIICLIYGEDDWKSFAAAATGAVITGVLLNICSTGGSSLIRAREGFLITAVIWIIFGLFGMIPFMTCSEPLSFTDAMFEIISGFTTTGASMFKNVESLSHGILFWRAFSQWIGGLGIIMFMLAILPQLNRAVGISMFNAEATGISHDKIHPRIRQTAISLWCIYFAVTAISIILLWIGPMNCFDSVCHSFTAVATGGFSTKNAGPSFWHSDYILIVLTVIMFIAGLNFMLLYSLYKGNIREFFNNTVLKAFSLIVLLSFLLLILSAGDDALSNDIAVTRMFHVVSAITSTGFSVTGAESWGTFSLFLTIVLMIAGACAGSTSGGIKTDRIVVLWRNLKNEIKKTIYPKRIYVVSLNGSCLESSQVTRISAFVTIYLLAVAIATGIITMSGYSFTDSLFMVSSCIGCNGLGYGITGAEGSFSLLPDHVKWLLTAVMLIGRLELFSFIVLFMPSFWK